MNGKIPEYKASSKEYLLALTLYVDYVKLINANGKQYEKLHFWLIENEVIFQNEEHRLPSVKELSTILNLDYSKFKKSLISLYNDIIELNTKEPEKFKKANQHLCLLNLNYIGRYTSFYVGMNVIPQINDTIDFHFIKPLNGGSYYYVKKIYHTLNGLNHEITITLEDEEQYLYLQLLKEKAYLQGNISLNEYIFPLTKALETELLRINKHL